ncbi:hypothetical protein [Bacteroidetes bacterium endosymbiont of Geopemphigus sp.]|uniref:hypothetical protein n=1 Tax=Bacteroidetes bacterium endosymbiont of Geopemphigus sp. TaxID=2047937 RepID=UPI000CD2D765|nr:hypothetical protein [Bacteroidetes bacterium endosymbiont of Geopemphigus sp.]
MDDKEITNAEYRKFVYEVRDSLTRELLAKMAEELAGYEQDEGIGQYIYLKKKRNKILVFMKSIFVKTVPRERVISQRRKTLKSTGTYRWNGI